MSRRKSDKRDGTPIKPLNNGDHILPPGPKGEADLTSPFGSDKPSDGKIVCYGRVGTDAQLVKKSPNIAGGSPMTDHVNHIQGMVNEAIRGTPYEGKIKIVDIVPRETGPQPPFNPGHCLEMAIGISLYQLGGAIKDAMEQPVDRSAEHLGIVSEMASIMSRLSTLKNRLKVGF